LKKSTEQAPIETKERGKCTTDEGWTMADLARMAGVPKITVSRALRDSRLVAPETRGKVRQLGVEQGYRPNVSPRNLRMRSSYSVAVVLEMTPVTGSLLSGAYPLELLGGITQELTAAGYSVVLTSKHLLNTPPVQGADGMILLDKDSHSDVAQVTQRSSLPLLIWEGPEPGGHYVVVSSEDRAGGASAARHFIEQGRRKLVFVGDINQAEVQERCAGFTRAVGAQGAVRILRPKAFTFEAGFECMSALLKMGGMVDGVFAASNTLATGAIHALAENELRVPEAVSVVGYDDTLFGAGYRPPFTSVHHHLHNSGMLLAQKMLALIEA
jgi:DNA-binding LacI/PurR family transcriptional regulator